MARACFYCQRGKVHKHVHLQPAEILVPHRRFTHIHVDLVGTLPPSRGHTYLFTIIDRTSRWPEAIPLSSITAASEPSSSVGGFRSLESLPPSHQTGGPISRPPYGRACAVCAAAAVPIYDRPYRVLERSTRFFLLEIGDRTDKVSTLRLTAARTPVDTEPANSQFMQVYVGLIMLAG